MRSMKKLLSSLLLVLLCMAVLAVPVSAEGTEASLAPTESNFQYALTVADLGSAAETYGDLPADIELVANQDITFALMNWTVAAKTATGEWGVAMDPSVSKDVPYKIFANTCGGASYSALAGYCCGLNFDAAYLEANPNLVVTLNLCVYEGETKHVLATQTFSAMDQFVASAKVGEETKYYMSLADAVAAGGEVTLLKTVTESVTIDKTLTLDLNGEAINSTGDAIVVTSGTLTINATGGGTVTGGSGDSYCAVWANGGAVIINGGNFHTGVDANGIGNDTIYTKHGGTVTIYGGYFSTAAESNSYTPAQYAVLNKHDSTGGAITVYGGTFANFDPANNVSEGANTSFVATGYEAIANDGIYTVYKHDPELIPAKAPTCTEDGNHAYYKCEACGLCYEVAGDNPGDEPYTDEDQFIDGATGHDPADVAEQQSTCIWQGHIKHYQCTKCKDLFTDEECTNPITAEEVKKPLADHDTEKHDAVEPDCSSSGNIEYYHCKVCTNLFKDKEATIPTTHEAVTLAPKHTPKYVGPVTATCTEPGNIAHYACKCGSLFKDEAGIQPTTAEAVTTYKDHSYTHVAEVAPTLEAAGNIAHKKCTVCKQLFAVEGHLLNEEDVIIPKLEMATSITMTSPKFEIYGNGLGVVVIEPSGYHNDYSAIGIVAAPEGAVIGDFTVTVGDSKIASHTAYDWDGIISHQICGFTPGTTTVTVTSESGLTASFELTVKPVPVLTLGAAEKFNVPAGFMTPFSFASKADGKYRITMDKSDAALALDIFDTTAGPIESTKIDSEDGKFVIEFELKKNKDYAIVIQNFVETEKTGTVTMEMVSHTHNMTKTEAKAATYTDAGNLEYYTCAACSKLFTDAEGKTETTLEKVTIPQMIEVEGTKAEVSEEAMDVAIEAAGTTGNVTLDLTKDEVIGEESAPVSSAVIPVASLEKVAEAGASLTLTKADATVTMDAKALETIAKAAGTGTVTLVVQEVKTEDLAVVQQNAVKDKKVAAVISAELINTATNENIGAEADGGFGGGTVTVQIPFTPEEGYKGTDYTVLYVADNGAVSEIKTEYKDGCLVVALDHFSEYVIVNTSYVKPSTGTNPATGDFGMVMPMTIMLLCGIAIAGLIIGKKKYNF